jgi:hypothetical protein
MPSYEVVEDSPTEIDGPPVMTYDGSYDAGLEAAPEGPDEARKRNTERR